MRRLIALSILALLLPFAADGRKPEGFSFGISLTRGERSRDSHSQTTRITLKGQELLYEKSYTGRGGSRSVPVRKSFRLRDEELEQLKKLVRDTELLKSDTLSAPEGESGMRRYFRIALNINLDGQKSYIEISGPRNATEIKEKRIFQKANTLLDAVYKILSEQDKEIGYENRDLISGSAD
jgi:hypothetical protein